MSYVSDVNSRHPGGTASGSSCSRKLCHQWLSAFATTEMVHSSLDACDWLYGRVDAQDTNPKDHPGRHSDRGRCSMRVTRVALSAFCLLTVTVIITSCARTAGRPVPTRIPTVRIPGIKLPAARPRPCSQERHLRSLNGKVPTVMGFRNLTSRPVAMFWLDYSGLRVFYQDVQPKAMWYEQTYVTHPWVVASIPNDRCREIFVASKTTTEADIH